jgi:hypothetical protein
VDGINTSQQNSTLLGIKLVYASYEAPELTPVAYGLIAVLWDRGRFPGQLFHVEH